MGKFKVTDPCAVAGCFRQRKTEVPFCARCWGIAEEGEQVMVRVAMHAPFWRISWRDKFEPGDVLFDGVAVPVNHGTPYVEFGGSGRMHQVSFDRILQEYEERTTIRAVADLLHVRRRFTPEAAELPIEEEDPHDQA